MTERQRLVLRTALASVDVKNMLSKLRLQIAESEIENCLRYPHVLQLKSRAHQIEERERTFAESICTKEQDDVLLLGNTAAIEGFFLGSRRPLQLKGVGEDRLDSPPGAFVQAFLRAWQASKGWAGIWLYINAPRITMEFATLRWNNAGTDPKLELQHLNGQIGRVIVYCSNGSVELPIKLPAGLR